MKRPMSYVAVSSALAVLVGSAWVTQAPPALAQVSKVMLAEIVNTPDQPVPVAVSNTPTVNVAGTPAVEIASSDRDPVIVRNAGDCMPFHTGLFFQILPGQNDASASFVVPADKRLVIEQVTVKATATPNGFVQAQIVNTADGVTITPDLIMVSQGVFAGDTKILLASQLVRWYADPGTIVEVRANKSFTENSFVHATISGYLVECQRRS